MKKYEFGAIVENEKLPCYRIEREGKITVYQTMMDMKNKKLVTYESKLTLAKVRNMTEVEIFTEKTSIEKKCIYDELNLEIKKLKKEN